MELLLRSDLVGEDGVGGRRGGDVGGGGGGVPHSDVIGGILGFPGGGMELLLRSDLGGEGP